MILLGFACDSVVKNPPAIQEMRVQSLDWEESLEKEMATTTVLFLSYHTVHWVLKVRILKWFAIAFSSGPRFVKTLHHDPSILGGLT